NLSVSDNGKSNVKPDIETSIESRNIQDLSIVEQRQKLICSIRNYLNSKVFAEHLSGYVEMDLESIDVGKLEELLEDIKLVVRNATLYQFVKLLCIQGTSIHE